MPTCLLKLKNDENLRIRVCLISEKHAKKSDVLKFSYS